SDDQELRSDGSDHPPAHPSLALLPAIDIALPLHGLRRFADLQAVARIDHYRILVRRRLRLHEHVLERFGVRPVREAARMQRHHAGRDVVAREEIAGVIEDRSEERRVGKEWRSGGVAYRAEDGIRVFHVTGVQTCALPISTSKPSRASIITAYSFVAGFDCTSMFLSALGCGPCVKPHGCNVIMPGAMLSREKKSPA